MNFDQVSGRHYLIKTTHASSEVVSWHLDVAVGALMLFSSTLSVLQKKKEKDATRSGLSETCHKCLSRLKGRHRGCA